MVAALSGWPGFGGVDDDRVFGGGGDEGAVGSLERLEELVERKRRGKIGVARCKWTG